jgi:hypothetical protein
LPYGFLLTLQITAKADEFSLLFVFAEPFTGYLNAKVTQNVCFLSQADYNKL